MAALLIAVPLTRAATAPDEARVCTWVLELAARAGEEPKAPDQRACEEHYAERRAALGWFAWGQLARCTLRAQTLPDAGGC